MLNSVEQRIIAEWCFTEDKRSQSDGGDGVQEHGGGLDHAADGAGLIHQIQDSPPTAVPRTYVWPSTRAGNSPSSLLRYAAHVGGFCGL